MSRPVRLGQVYRCPVCGAEVAVINAASQALEPYCCNEPMTPLDRVLVLYRCPVCGAEVAVIRDRGGPLELVCCRVPMERRDSPVPEAA